ncbi:MAG TPA: hypothetical protein VMG80_04600 [Solirubrobacteraceae bacterium]|nr:hypothetical protein [Solirubrobacteraceae bacterium]
MKLRKRYLPVAAVLGAGVAIVPALADAPSEAKLEVNENCVVNSWPCWATPGSGAKPAPASKIAIAVGGEVKFTDNTSTKANIAWTGTVPTCSSGVPVNPNPPQAPWEGTCRFEQPGTYTFESSTLFNGGPGENYTKYEIVAEAGGAGTNTDTTTSTRPKTTTTTTAPTSPTTKTTTTAPTSPTTKTTTTTPTTRSELSYGSLLQGGAKALELAGSQHGSTVRGSIEVSEADSGGRLEVGLFAAAASLAKARHTEQVRVGRLTRFPLKTGSVSFSVPLSARGKAVLRRHRRLALTVKLKLTPLHGAAVTVTRGVVVRA